MRVMGFFVTGGFSGGSLSIRHVDRAAADEITKLTEMMIYEIYTINY
jgi:hypothetical protein